MIDSTRREEEEEKAINDDYNSDDSNNGGNNYDGGDIANNNEGIPGGEYGKFYEQYLYSLIPAIYQEYDAKKENNVLQEFLKIISSQAATIRQDIDGLLNNFFIKSCEEWVIPYIADLIASKVVPNSSLNSRLDVQNTIRWRKLKGTQMGFVDLIRNTINRNAKVKEAFRYCSSSQHLAFGASDIVVNKPYNFVNLRDQDALSNIDMENDSMPHTIDVREPSQASGWYNIKNLLLFMPQLNVYHIRQVQVEGEEDGLRYYFSNLVRKQQQQLSSSSSSSPSPSNNHFPLYDLDEGVKISGTTFARDPFKYFGKKRGMSVWIDNILAACQNAPTFSPAKQEVNVLENRVTISGRGAKANRSTNSNDPYQGDHDSNNNSSSSNNPSNADPDFVSLHKTEGIRILEQRNFSEPDKKFIIRLYCYSEENGPAEVGNYSTTKMSYYILPASKLKKIASGTILISVELDHSKMSAVEFPETVIAIQDSRPKKLVDDSIQGKYRNALYVYLPSILINYKEKKYFLVDRRGSTYEVQMINRRYDIRSSQLGGPGRIKENLRNRTAPSSQIYPPRQLTYSMRPLDNFAELNRLNGIKVVDAKKYGKESFLIEAIAINYDKEQAWKIGKLQIKKGSFQYVNEKEVWIRWRIILDGPPGVYNEILLPACHFKATRLNLEKNFEEYTAKDTAREVAEIVNSVLPEEILSEYALDKKVGTFSINPALKEAGSGDIDKYNTDNADEYEVKISIRPEYLEQFEYLANEIKNAIDNKPVFINKGKLMLRISNTTHADFPLSEIILTNNSGESMLVYLPQLYLDKKYDLHVTDDGSTSHVTDDGSTSHEEDLLNPARKSAGQIIPIANKYPLRAEDPCLHELGRLAVRW